MKVIIRIIGIVGIILFGSFFCFTFSTPGYVEEIGKDFIKEQIQKETHEKIDDIKLQSKESIIGKFAEQIYIKQQEEIDNIK